MSYPMNMREEDPDLCEQVERLVRIYGTDAIKETCDWLTQEAIENGDE